MSEMVTKETTSITAFKEFRSQLEEFKKLNSEVVFDYEDPKGNKEARSHIYRMRQSKSTLEKARKKEKEASLAYGRLVDKQAKEIEQEIEKKRIEDIREKINRIVNARTNGLSSSKASG